MADNLYPHLTFFQVFFLPAFEIGRLERCESSGRHLVDVNGKIGLHTEYWDLLGSPPLLSHWRPKNLTWDFRPFFNTDLHTTGKTGATWALNYSRNVCAHILQHNHAADARLLYASLIDYCRLCIVYSEHLHPLQSN